MAYHRSTAVPQEPAAGPNPYRRPIGPIRHLEATSPPRPTLQSVDLNWRPPSGGRLIDHYVVYASRQPRFGPEGADVVVVKAPVSRYLHTSLGPEPQTWHYRVVAVDAAGNVGSFEKSPQVSVTTAQAFVVAATASSQYSDQFSASRAIDGSMATRWAGAQSDDEWIQVELARTVEAGRAELHWQGAHAVDYDLMVSADGRSWTTVAEVRGKSDASVDRLDIDGAGAFRFVRMHGLVRVNKWGFSLWEFWVLPPGS
jgi:hypothetical protein